jgi:hypothetical protein
MSVSIFKRQLCIAAQNRELPFFAACSGWDIDEITRSGGTEGAGSSEISFKIADYTYKPGFF